MTIQQLPPWRASSYYLASKRSQALNQWLLSQGSMTARLLVHSQQTLQVVILQQGWQSISLEEAHYLGIAPRSQVLLRKTLLMGFGVPWILAISLFPRQLFTGTERGLPQQLSQQPIGKFLFKHPNMRQRGFQLAPLNVRHDIYHQAMAHSQGHCDTLWARRSRFYLNHKPLMVSEIFLPEIETL